MPNRKLVLVSELATKYTVGSFGRHCGGGGALFTTGAASWGSWVNLKLKLFRLEIYLEMCRKQL